MSTKYDYSGYEEIITSFNKIRLQVAENLSKHTLFAIMLPIFGPFHVLNRNHV